MSIAARKDSRLLVKVDFRRWDQLTIVVLYTGIFLLRWLAYLPSSSTPTAWDGPAYMAMANRPFGDVFVGDKTFLVPLIYQLLGVQIDLIAAFQFTLSLFAWGFLAWRVGAHLAPKAVSIFGMLVILAFSATPTVAYWDRSMLSESMSISLLALMLAMGLMLFEGWHPAKGAALVVFGFLWAFTRHSNAYILAILALLFVGMVMFKRAPKGYLAVASCFLLTFGVGLYDTDKSYRWNFPMLDVIGQRVLTDQSTLSYFQDHGMPVTPALIERTGDYGDGGDLAFYNDPELEGFREWMRRDSRRTYMTYLLTHPLWTLSKPNEEFSIIFSTPYMNNYRPLNMGEPLGTVGTELVAPQGPMFLLLTLLGVVSMWVLVKVKPNRTYDASHLSPLPVRVGQSRKYMFALLVLLLALAYGYLSWHGDPMELMRHSVQAGILLRIGLWLLVLLALEQLMGLRRADSQSAPATLTGGFPG